MERRDEFKTRVESNTAQEASDNLLNYIEWLNLPTKSHNELIELIDAYAGEQIDAR